MGRGAELTDCGKCSGAVCTHVKGLGLKCICFQEPTSNWPSQRKQWEKGKWKAVEKRSQNNLTRRPKGRTVSFVIATLQFSHLGFEQEQWGQPKVVLVHTGNPMGISFFEHSETFTEHFWSEKSHRILVMSSAVALSLRELIIISKARSAGKVSDTILLIGFIYLFFPFQCLL